MRYNSQNLRISKTVGNNTDSFVLVGGDVWADSEHSYLRGIELITNGEVYYLYNIHGDVIQLVNASGEVEKTYDYDAYGNEYARDSSDSNPFRYCGEYYDTETGFIYLRARYYDPETGRFNAEDPAKDGTNWYAYCDGNPVMFVDRNGLSKKRVHNAIADYVLENNKTDNNNSMYAPGNLYDTIDEAAIAFAHYIYEKSISEKAEYASFIYMANDDTYLERLINHLAMFMRFCDLPYDSENAMYTFVEPQRFKDDEKAADSSRIPINWSMLYKVAEIHTHAEFNKKFRAGSDNFSDTDIELSERREIVSYVVTPRGYVRRYNPIDDSNVIIYRGAPYDPNHAKRR